MVLEVFLVDHASKNIVFLPPSVSVSVSVSVSAPIIIGFIIISNDFIYARFLE